MKPSTDVTLPRDYRPVFPDKCIVCHNSPDSTIGIARNAQNPFVVFFVPILMLFGWSRVEIPICKRCKFRFRLQRWGRELTGWLLMLVACSFIWPYFRTWPSLTRKIVVAALVIVVVSPHFLIEVFWPRIFDTTADSDSIDYEFASEEYADEFAVLNIEHVLKWVAPKK